MFINLRKKEMDHEDGSERVKEISDYQRSIAYHEKDLEISKGSGDQGGEGRAYANLGIAYQSLGDYGKAIEYHEKHLKIAKDIGDQGEEGVAYGNLGIAYHLLDDYRKATEYHEKHLKIAKEIGDRRGEGRAYRHLGIAYKSLREDRKAIESLEKSLEISKEIRDQDGEGKAYGSLGYTFESLGDSRKAIEYHEKHLKIAKDIGDQGGEGGAYGNLGTAYQSLGNYRKATEYHKKHLKIAKEVGDQSEEGRAYTSLGFAYHSVGDYRKAIESHEKHLEIAKEIGDQGEEGKAYGHLGIAYRSLGDCRKAIEYHEKHLKIAKEIGDQDGGGGGYGNLGNAFQSMGDYRKAIEYHEKHIEIAKEIGDQRGEGRAYANLGIAYDSLGDYRKAIEYHEKHIKIAKEIGYRGGEGKGYGNLGNAYHALGYYKKAIEYHEKHIEIAKEIGDQGGEGRAYGNLGNVYQSLGDHRKAIEYHEKHLKIAIEIGDRGGEGRAYGSLGNAYRSLGDYRKAIEYHEKHLKIAIESGDREGEAGVYHNIGLVYVHLKQFENAVVNFVCSLNALNILRSCLKSKDDWKIKFRQLHDKTYTGLCWSLLNIGEFDEALFAAEQGRAQALCDNLLIKYKLTTSLSAVSIDTKETISRLLAERSTPTIFLATHGLRIYIWFLRREKTIAFRQGRLEGDRRETDPIRALLRTALKNIGAEFKEKRKCGSLGEPPSDNPFQPFYDAVIRPIADLLAPQDDELVIVPDGPLCLTPWATIIKSSRIRTVPSLTSYQLIASAPEGHHKKSGALLVGNPCLDQLNLKEQIPELDISLTYAQEEVRMIASILKTSPLTGSEATKAEVIKQMSSVGLIHIAAHGNESTGEIFLSPNPGWTSKFPQKKDFILKMSDVQAANLRARLVVLSCCYTGQGRIFKGEGVVGIARAFLAAGARSVLVTLWKVHDEATMVFMKSFYQLLKKGKTASAAVHQSMKCLRESERFSEMRYWAPFQLIGDDVKIEFEADDDIKK